MTVEKYSDCIAELRMKGRRTHLLMGNGFSMAYDREIFSYNALQNFISEIHNPVLDELFEVVKSKNLEVIMQQLHLLTRLIQMFGDNGDLTNRVTEADNLLRVGLVDAVKSLHPDHVFQVPEEQIQSCHKFLEPYLAYGSNIFTTNYDILLYWTLMRGGVRNAVDGFGYEMVNPGEEDPNLQQWFETLTWGPNVSSQNIHYLHGALHLFDNGIDIEKEAYDGENVLLDLVRGRMDREEYPVFVTAGDGKEKLSQIMHNRYLSHCYKSLASITGSLVVFGFNFGKYDEHIIDAINTAAHHGRRAGEKLFSVYIGAFSQADVEHIESIRGKFRCKVRIYDSKSVDVWGGG